MAKIIDFFQSRTVRERRFDELIRPHIRALYRMAYRWTQSPEDAEDLIQEALVKLVNRIGEMERVEKLRPWLIKILYRCFVDFHRKQGRTPLADNPGRGADTTLFEERIAESRPDQDSVKRLELQRDLVKALDTLDEDQWNVVLLHDTEGYTAAEIASILEISIGTVKSRLHRARSHLKSFLE